MTACADWRGPAGALRVHVARDRLAAVERLAGDPAPQPPEALDPLAARAIAALRAWFADPAVVPDIPLAPAPTAFQARLRQALCAIPPGQVATYGELARMLGSSPRAVGAACGANPLPIVVPCHRVVAADGIGGYGGAGAAGDAVAFKRWLLEHERRGGRAV
jgi:methylated-DNA-[protein]-cysteine S-methyltransferase